MSTIWFCEGFWRCTKRKTTLAIFIAYNEVICIENEMASTLLRSSAFCFVFVTELQTSLNSFSLNNLVPLDCFLQPSAETLCCLTLKKYISVISIPLILWKSVKILHISLLIFPLLNLARLAPHPMQVIQHAVWKSTVHTWVAICICGWIKWEILLLWCTVWQTLRLKYFATWT